MQRVLRSADSRTVVEKKREELRRVDQRGHPFPARTPDANADTDDRGSKSSVAERQGKECFFGADAGWMIQIPETDLPGGKGTRVELGENGSQAGPCPGMSRKVYAPGSWAWLKTKAKGHSTAHFTA